MPIAQHRATAAAVASSASDADREFVFSDADFRGLAKVAYDYAGIALSDSKRNLIYSRLSRRLRTLGLGSFRDYRDYLAETEGEMEQFINAISTNLTRFFRESHHFEHLRDEVAARYAKLGSRGGRMRIWSAGCSTGEEPYTIAVTLANAIRDFARQDIRVLATDIDTAVIARGIAAEYPVNSTEDVPRVYREYFKLADNGSDLVLRDDIRSLIRFGRLNLMERWPFSGKFDAIFCRNVMIYFDNPTKSQIIDRFVDHLNPGGYLYIGHSESLMGAQRGLHLVGRTIYRREA